MVNYLIKRFLYGVAVIVFVVIIVTSIIYLAPVDPARLTFGQRSDVSTVEQKREELGLDRPLWVQLSWYLNDISPLSIHSKTTANLDKYHARNLFTVGEQVVVVKWPYLRRSFQTGRLVSEMLAEAIPKTLLLALFATLLATVFGIFFGVFAALHHQKTWDQFLVAFSVIGYSVPSYVAAIFLALIFGYFLHEYTGLNVQGSLTEISLSDRQFGQEVIVWKNLFLPVLALGIRPVAIITQLTRSAMLDTLSQDYIRTAKAKGLPFGLVVVKHALQNALNPVVTAISGWFAALLAGAFFVENVFAFKGLGEMTVTALINFDIPVVIGAVVFTSIAFVLVNIVADFLYRLINPKLRT